MADEHNQPDNSPDPSPTGDGRPDPRDRARSGDNRPDPDRLNIDAHPADDARPEQMYPIERMQHRRGRPPDRAGPGDAPPDDGPYIDDILRSLEGVQDVTSDADAANGYQEFRCACPAHADTGRSLRILCAPEDAYAYECEAHGCSIASIAEHLPHTWVELLGPDYRRGIQQIAERESGDGQPGRPPEVVADVGEGLARFWYVERGKLKIRLLGILEFLRERGFGKTYIEDEDTSRYIRVVDSKVYRVSRERIIDFVMRYAEHLPDEYLPEGYGHRDLMETLLRGSKHYFGSHILRRLPEKDLRWHRDTSDTGYVYFRNGYVEVTPEGRTLHSYADMDGVIWADQVIDHDIRLDHAQDRPPSSWDWYRHLWYVSGQDQNRFEALQSAIGYLVHSYKDPSETRAVVFCDEQVSGVEEGRTGKSLTARGIMKMVNAVSVDARNFSFDSRFAFQRVSHATGLLNFNDASKDFPFERLFSLITDDFIVERKGESEFEIPFEDSPKMLLSTNYTLNGGGASFRDRVFEIEFAPHYTETRGPLQIFGRRFFDGWDPAEWNRFYLSMIGCVQLYLQRGLVTAEPVNLPFRKLIQQTNEQFATWIMRKELRQYDKTALFRSFVEDHEDFDRLWQGTFTKWIKTYARLFRLDVTEGHSGDSDWIRLSATDRSIDRAQYLQDEQRDPPLPSTEHAAAQSTPEGSASEGSASEGSASEGSASEGSAPAPESPMIPDDVDLFDPDVWDDLDVGDHDRANRPPDGPPQRE